MRKFSLHVLVAAMFLIGSGLPAAAQVDAIGILGYNTYSLDWGGEYFFYLFGKEMEFFDSGFGGMALIRYWLTDSVAVAAGVDYLRGSGRDSVSSTYWLDIDGDYWGDVLVTETLTLEPTLSSLGILAVVAGRVSIGSNMTLEPFVGVGSYGASLKIDGSIKDTTGWQDKAEVTFTADRQIGYLAGARLGFPVSPNVKVGGSVGYRSVGEFTSGRLEYEGFSEDIDDLTGFDVSGFFAGLTVSIAF